jgi:hypothetical protein
MGADRTVTERQAYGLGEMLTEIGGLYSALFAGFGGFCLIFSHWNM